MKKILVVTVLILTVCIAFLAIPIAMKVDVDNTDALLVAAIANAESKDLPITVTDASGTRSYDTDLAVELISMLDISERERANRLPEGDTMTIGIGDLTLTAVLPADENDVCYIMHSGSGRVRIYSYQGYAVYSRLAKLFS